MSITQEKEVRRMFKNQFEAIAQAISQNVVKDFQTVYPYDGTLYFIIHSQLIEDLCSVLKAFNSAFDKKKFKKACGI